jgi:hypothetical protein
MICASHAAEKQKGRQDNPRVRIEFSGPGDSEVTTNLNQLTSKKDTLKLLEEDLSLHLKSLTPKSSLDGVMAPPVERPTPSVIPNKKLKELLERRKYWYIMNPEDITSAPSAEEMFKLPEYDKNGEEKKKKTPLEKYFERQRNSDGLMQDSKEKQPGSRKRFKTREEQDNDEDLPDSIAKTSKSLKTLNESNSSNNVLSPLSRQDTFTDVFGLEKSRPSELSAPQIAAQKARLEEFKQLLNFSPTLGASPGEQADSLRGVNDLRTGAAAGGYDTLPNPLRFDATKPFASPLTAPAITPATAFSPPVALGGLPDVTPKVFAPGGSLPPPPRIDPPKPTAPSPIFGVPQRKF